MITPEFLLAWFLVMFPLVYSPGPANTMFASNGAAYGFRRTIPFMTGLDIAFVVQSLAVGFGLSSVLVAYPQLLTFFRYFGIAYILYLGSKFLKAAMAETPELPRCMGFRDGLILTAVNPKAWVMQVMMFSQFFQPGDEWVSSIMSLTLLLCGLNISGHIVWILFGSLLISRATSRFTMRHQNMAFAAMLFGSIWFLV